MQSPFPCWYPQSPGGKGPGALSRTARHDDSARRRSERLRRRFGLRLVPPKLLAALRVLSASAVAARHLQAARIAADVKRLALWKCQILITPTAMPGDA